MSRVNPLSEESLPPEFASVIDRYKKVLGFVPNSLLTMARKPKVAKAFNDLGAAIWQSLTVPHDLYMLVFHMASYARGCRYCQAHSIHILAHSPTRSAAKLDALWSYETSPLFTEAERAAMRFAQSAAAVPNAVTDVDIDALRHHFSEDQIVELTVMIAFAAWLNCWNDTLATELEAPPFAEAERILGDKGWTAGKHAGATGAAD
jgi:uncharacterized peroxidase-related enzyme